MAEIGIASPTVAAEQVGDLFRDPLRLGPGQIDLVDHRDQLEAVLDREVGVGDGLRLDPLGRVDDQQRPLAGGEAARDLVGEVDVAGRVDQVQVVGLPVGGPVLDPHRLGLDRDPALALEVHRVEHLGTHFLRVDGAGDLEDPVGERRLAVVDVGDDREVADLVHRRAEYGEDDSAACSASRPRAAALRHISAARKESDRDARYSVLRGCKHPDGSSGPVSLKTIVGGSRRMTWAFGPSVQRAGRGIGRQARFDAVAAGDDVFVFALVDEAAPLPAAARGDEPAVWLVAADELDLVREIGSEQRVLAGAGRRDPLAGDGPRGGEDGVQARGGEGRVRVAVLQVVALDRVADRDRERPLRPGRPWAKPTPGS